MINPFSNDIDRSEIWEMLVARDIAAFVAADWSMVANDFIETGFMGIDAKRDPNPDHWVMGFPTLKDYKTEWLKQAAQSQITSYAEPLEAAIHRATSLTQIDITGDAAIAHKKFDGSIHLSDGTTENLNWQTLYYCRKAEGRWKISGFTGYMAYRFS